MRRVRPNFPALVAGFFMRGRMAGMFERLGILVSVAWLAIVAIAIGALIHDIAYKRRKFSLKTLLMATAFVAAVLGILVYFQ